ncbi:DUF6624 domain-containing protein [Mucilaginibacter glaciei]|uniref:Uncharacterized protein n=1 Tax=Mucilaginibacter glaciei TaxID=2772109 RepID=A0A926S843_9SPHI|nr:DUF6624 domain-containing protein [Mucilaginibacter glaciei]MBD1395381.1 hypothetical protein [Mucilaginibacter glaciei]
MKKLLIMCFCLLYVATATAQQKKFNGPLADSLAKLVVVDQQAAYIPTAELKKLTPEQWDKFKDSVFSTHQKILSHIFNQYGYPGYDLVGKKGSNNFWLMVQHCDKWPEFQQKILAAMKIEMIKENADSKNFAYLTDRVNLNTGKKQVYGTQLTYNTKICQALPRPLTDSLNVNARRKEVGLPPIENYLNQMSTMHFEMNKDSYQKRGINKPALFKEEKNNM